MVITPDEIQQLETFFKSIILPKSIPFGPGITISDVPKFVESHLTILRSSGSKPVFESFAVRLFTLRNLLEKQK